MALGTNYKRTASGIYDLATCYKMAVVVKDEAKKAQFRSEIENYKNASENIKKQVLKDISKFEKEYK